MAEVVVALDHREAAEALRLVERLEPRWVKIGATLFTATGPGLVDTLKAKGIRVFLDLKWHDIPHQVAGAVAAAVASGADLATVHGLGGIAMMQAAADAAAGRMPVVAVTILTSHSPGDLEVLLGRHPVDPGAEARRLAQLATAAGLQGVVSSPVEASGLRQLLGPQALLVVPGIRPPGSRVDDQRRTADPLRAVEAGATHLVVGRPITGAEDPAQVYNALCEAVR